MKGMHDYIIQIKEAYNDSFTTENGVKLFLDKRFSGKELANKHAVIIDTPALAESILKPGYEVIVDPTIHFKQKYERHGENDNIFFKDQKEGLYKIQPSMIIMYREDKESSWKGYNENLLVEFIKEDDPETVKSSIIITEIKTKKNKDGLAKAKFVNAALNEEGVNENDLIVITKGRGIPIMIEGKEYFWIRNSDVLVKLNEN